MKNRAFTLIEMLVVVIIIGIMFIVVVPNLTNVISNQNDKALKIHLDNLEQATKLYIFKNRGKVLSNSSYTLNYQTLINEDYISEADIKCCGNIVINVLEDHSDSKDIVYNLKCVYGDNNEPTTKNDNTCSNFNGNF